MKDFAQYLEDFYPINDNVLKIVAHPQKSSDVKDSNYYRRKRVDEMRSGERNDPNNLNYSCDILQQIQSQSFKHIVSSIIPRDHPKRFVICIGPDGGWTDDELYYFHKNHFHFLSLGDRIFRTDMAVSIYRLRLSELISFRLCRF